MAILIGSDFKNDPRIKRARQQILLALQEYQRKVRRVIPPNPNMKVPYEQIVEEFGRLRVGNLFLPYVGTGFGNGPFVELSDGSVKYDMITGIGVHFLGHNNPILVEAALDAALSDTIMQGNLQQNMESFHLCKKLVELANRGRDTFSRVFLSSSGAMANENALKLAFFQKHPRTRILAFERCFMGRTLALAAVTDKPAYRKNLPVWPQVDYIPFFNVQDPEGSQERALQVLKKHLAEHPGEYAVFAMECIQGEAGSYAGNQEFFKAILEVIKAEDIAVLVDEIQTFGRTRDLFAFQLFELDNYVDLVTIGKLSQVCATLFRESFKPPPGLISQTFTGATSAIMAANAILEEITTGDYLGLDGRINHIGNSIRSGILEMANQYPNLIQGPYGLGAMIVFTAFDGDLEKNRQFIHSLFDNGVIAFLTGSDPVRVRMLPPIGAMTEEHVQNVLLILEATLNSFTHS